MNKDNGGGGFLAAFGCCVRSGKSDGRMPYGNGTGYYGDSDPSAGGGFFGSNSAAALGSGKPGELGRGVEDGLTAGADMTLVPTHYYCSVLLPLL